MAPAPEQLAASREDLEFEKVLGKGFMGEVWRARVRRAGADGLHVAVKRVRLSHVARHRCEEHLRREIGILQSLRHPRCIRLLCHFTQGGSTYLVMELASGGSLWQRLSKAGKFPPQQAARYFAETCEALDYLHNLPEKVVHRDIKPENILLDAEDRVKLADFGLANTLEEQFGRLHTFCGTLDYLPPEMLRRSGHDQTVDMWSMGVLLYELTTGRSPFSAGDKETTCRLILRGQLKFPASLDEDARDLILLLCRSRPAERPSARGALQHPFVAKFPADVRGPAADVEEGGKERQLLLAAKRRSEETLMRLADELDEAHAAVRRERRRRMDMEVACAKLAHSVAAREQELRELRGEASVAEAGAAKKPAPEPRQAAGDSRPAARWAKAVGGG